jgi:hypothetical protein
VRYQGGRGHQGSQDRSGEPEGKQREPPGSPWRLQVSRGSLGHRRCSPCSTCAFTVGLREARAVPPSGTWPRTLDRTARSCQSRRQGGCSRAAAGAILPAVAGPGAAEQPATDDGGAGQGQPRNATTRRRRSVESSGGRHTYAHSPSDPPARHGRRLPAQRPACRPKRGRTGGPNLSARGAAARPVGGSRPRDSGDARRASS